MINEERVKQMTKIALFEERYSHDFQPMLKSDKKGYVSATVVKCVIADTIFYMALCCIIYIAIVGYTGGVNLISKLLLLITAAVIYVLFIVFHVSAIKKRALKEYKRGRRMIKHLYDEYGRLGQMYTKSANALSNKRPRPTGRSMPNNRQKDNI